MSKRIKALVERDVRTRLDGVEECVVVDFTGVSAEDSVVLRRSLRAGNVTMLVVKNALARRALKGTRIESAATLFDGPSALCYGGDDPVALARVVDEQAGEDGRLSIRGGSVEGRALGPDEMAALAKLPTRTEMIAGIAARAAAPAKRIVSLAKAPAARVAGQIGTLADQSDGGDNAAPEQPAPVPAEGASEAADAADPETERGDTEDG